MSAFERTVSRGVEVRPRLASAPVFHPAVENTVELFGETF